jgi:cytochrome bd ubiquinol oxidase subunit II
MVIFWVFVLALSILLYALLDGFDLGVGILSGFTHDRHRRREMMSAVAPVWDGNETWLIAAGVVLWGAFPLAYATLFSALYLPLLVMLAGLILRGVAFEFRANTESYGWLWDFAFAGGSLIAAFTQGVMIGALVEGLPISNGLYSGGEFGWLSLFSALCGVGLSLGYTLLGACWLIRKSEDQTRAMAYRVIPRLSVAIVAFLIAVFAYALAHNLRVMDRWRERPYLFVFPILAAAAAIVLGRSVRRRRDSPPFYLGIVVFAAAFGSFLVTFWPYMIPFSITVQAAAAPAKSLSFMFWGEGIFVLPLMLFYTVISYRVFRGRLESSSQEY